LGDVLDEDAVESMVGVAVNAVNSLVNNACVGQAGPFLS
jgi:hypothetical protein